MGYNYLIYNKCEWNHCFIKNADKISRTDFKLVFNFEQTRTVTIFGGHGIMAISKIQLAVYYQWCVLIG